MRGPASGCTTVADPRVGRRIVVARVVVSCCLSFADCSGFLHPATESSVMLRGRVADVRAPATCSLQLYRANGKLAREATVAPEFQRALTIAPGQHKYYIEVSCAGRSGKFRSETYTIGGWRTIELGTFALK